MLIAGVLCLVAALASAGFGAWALLRPAADTTQLVLRAVAPAQLAAAVMLVAGGAVALARPANGAVVVMVCVAGALGTLAAGSWQGARFAAQHQTAAGCGGDCAACTLPCH